MGGRGTVMHLLAAVSGMGREAKILLGMLGLLAGVFCGVLSMKLFVHRPPTGAGPDVRHSFAATEAAAESRWPALSASAFAAAPAVAALPMAAFQEDHGHHEDAHVADASGGQGATGVRPGGRADGHDDRDGSGDVPHQDYATAGRFARDRVEGGGLPDARAGGQRSDPFVSRASYDEEPVPGAGSAHEATGPVVDQSQGRAARAGTVPRFDDGAGVAAVAPARDAGPTHFVQPGDSWWHVAEQAYGDGRFYRALFAWNRAIDPRVSLAPGTRLEIPPRDRLIAAWPQLTPR